MQHSLKIPMISLLTIVGGLSGALGADRDSALFKITKKRNDDTVAVKTENSKTTFAIHSPSGISQAVIRRTEDKWPADLVLQLHLKGLESFRISNGKLTLNVAVSSQAGKRQPRQWIDDKEDSPLASDSPLWTKVQSVGADGKPVTKIPLEAGYFELHLPKAFFEDAPQSMTLNWIDFYRN